MKELAVVIPQPVNNGELTTAKCHRACALEGSTGSSMWDQFGRAERQDSTGSNRFHVHCRSPPLTGDPLTGRPSAHTAHADAQLYDQGGDH